MSRRAKTIRVDHQATAETLRKQPGEWLPIADYRNRGTADRMVSAICNGRPVGRGYVPYLPAGAFEARLEFVEDGTRIHARFIGEVPAAEHPTRRASDITTGKDGAQ